MADIFISYASKDRPTARQLAEALEACGWSVWWDYRGLRGGQHFERVIEEEISRARAVIVVWSQNSINSDWVRAEASHGLEEKKLAPVRIDSATLPLRFRNIHTIDLSSWSGERGVGPFRRLYETLSDYLGAPRKAKQPSPRTGPSSQAEPTDVAAMRRAEPSQEPTKLVFAQEPSPAPEWCVSYAWGDDTPEGRDREAIVDRLCAEAVAQGKQVLRDKKDMGLGKQISKFMRRIGLADRVFVVLSDKYLKSPFCMFELSEVWRTSQQEDEEFLRRIRVYTLPCAKIWTPMDRANYAIHWKQQHDALEALVKEHGYDILGERDAQQLRRMRDFSRNVGDILATVADILQPRSFDELVRYGFKDLD